MNDVPSNIAVAYHGVTWVTHTVGVSTLHEPEVNLICQFDRLPDETLFYDVTWYVDDTEVLTNQTVSSNSSDLALLTGSQMFAKGKKANSMVKSCTCNYLFNMLKFCKLYSSWFATVYDFVQILCNIYPPNLGEEIEKYTTGEITTINHYKPWFDIIYALLLCAEMISILRIKILSQTH